MGCGISRSDKTRNAVVKSSIFATGASTCRVGQKSMGCGVHRPSYNVINGVSALNPSNQL